VRATKSSIASVPCKRFDAQHLPAPGDRRLPHVERPERLQHGARAGHIGPGQRPARKAARLRHQIGAQGMGADDGNAVFLEDRSDIAQKRVVALGHRRIRRGISALVTSSSAVGSSGGRDIAPAKADLGHASGDRSSNSAPRRSNRAGSVPPCRLHIHALEGHHMGRIARQSSSRAAPPRPR
jgi:hypothetical protein